MDADGANVVRLTRSPGLYGDPDYSPDGTLIAFDSTVPGSEGVFVMNAADGSDMRRITGLPEGVTTAYAPRFSPDGTELVFTGVIDDRSGGLYVVGLDGSGLRRITPPTLSPDKAAWSPSSHEIVFDAGSAGYPFQSLWTVRADGSALTNITAAFGKVRAGEATDGFSGPAWSPDGSLILAVHGLHQGDGSSTLRLATIRPDGAGLRDVSEGVVDGFKPDWTDTAC
jgi:TolB protein